MLVAVAFTMPHPSLRFVITVLVALAAAAAGHSQAIQSRGALRASPEEPIHVSPQRPQSRLRPCAVGEVSLSPGLYRERRELTKAYLLRLKTDDLLQNHLLEAGVRIDKPYEQMHQGWESPHYQVRGHFLGHWLSAAERFAAIDRDPLLAARAREVVAGLQRCQMLNGGQWVGSIPTKYFDLLADGRVPVWSPQYTVHKTLMGLFDAYRYGQDQQALAVLEHAAEWFDSWSAAQVAQGRGDVPYAGECAGMLELWADLYGATGHPRYLQLISRYGMPDIFRALLAGGDPLSNDHANASIPWIQGAARVYEVTGDARYRQIVEAFWQQAVVDRGMFATTGNNAGEFWIPAGQFARFLGSRTQEHCTVYNMIRVAQYLQQWTGESRYADYIERALYNGLLAQQNPHTGMVAYFLPLQPGAKKIWGSETRDFWCCHGTLVQAQALYEDLIYYRAADAITVSQFIPSRLAFGETGHQVRLSQKIEAAGRPSDFSHPGGLTHFVTELTVAADQPERWTLRLRQPGWAAGPVTVTIDGAPVTPSISADGFVEIEREWKTATVKVSIPKRVTREPLPGDAQRFALLDGPVVLAAVSETEPELADDAQITPHYEHQYVDGRDWLVGHYWVRSQRGTVAVKPLYEIADESYCVYFAGVASRDGGVANRPAPITASAVAQAR